MLLCRFADRPRLRNAQRVVKRLVPHDYMYIRRVCSSYTVATKATSKATSILKPLNRTENLRSLSGSSFSFQRNCCDLFALLLSLGERFCTLVSLWLYGEGFDFGERIKFSQIVNLTSDKFSKRSKIPLKMCVFLQLT